MPTTDFQSSDIMTRPSAYSGELSWNIGIVAVEIFKLLCACSAQSVPFIAVTPHSILSVGARNSQFGSRSAPNVLRTVYNLVNCDATDYNLM